MASISRKKATVKKTTLNKKPKLGGKLKGRQSKVMTKGMFGGVRAK